MFGIIRTIINIVFGAIELLLTLRFVFKFFAVGASSEFITWLYGFTTQMVAPFVGILPNWKISGFVVDFSTLIALIIYSLIGYFLMWIFSYAGSRYYNN